MAIVFEGITYATVSELSEIGDLFKEVISDLDYPSKIKELSVSYFSLATLINWRLLDPKSFQCAWVLDNNQRVLAGFSLSMIQDGVLTLYWLIVKKIFRKKGYAAILMNYLEGSAGERFYHKISLEVLASNEISIDFFLKFGYTKVALLRKHWYKENYCLFEKILNE